MLLIICLAGLPAQAQEQALFENDLARIAEILGALHHLRPLCGAAEGQQWRSEMQALVDAERQAPGRRERLIGAFNAGYTAYERAYSRCTPAAITAQRNFLEEGAKLARDIRARFGSD